MTLCLAITPGEPAGIGADLLIKLVQEGHTHELVALADPQTFIDRAGLLGLPLHLREPNGHGLKPGELAIEPIALTTVATPGVLNAANAAAVLNGLQRAVTGCRKGEYAALVTGPVHKGIINEAGFKFSGHTEYLAEQSGTSRVVMMLAAPTLRVALATTHIPLSAVASALSQPLLEEVVRILHSDMRSKFSIDAPCIAVCGLNPHAGEGGHLGTEEIDIITPVLTRLREQGMNIVGPLPADSLFTPKYLQTADVVLAMYHDQGLPVLKYAGFGEAVNITLGLPFIRTSVDHGTALELAGSGEINTGSLRAAINTAIELASPEKRQAAADD